MTIFTCREGMKAKKRVTKLVLAVITVFTGKDKVMKHIQLNWMIKLWC